MTVPFTLADRRANAQPRDLAFYRDPYAFYDAVHADSPAFFWENYNHWCFAVESKFSMLPAAKLR